MYQFQHINTMLVRPDRTMHQLLCCNAAAGVNKVTCGHKKFAVYSVL